MKNELTRRDHMIVAHLAAGRSQRETAELLGTYPKTIWRRLQIPAVKQALATARGAVYQQILDRASSLGVKAVETLEGLLDDDSVPAQQVSAAFRILSEIRAYREAGEFQKRLQELEEKLELLVTNDPAGRPEAGLDIRAIN